MTSELINLVKGDRNLLRINFLPKGELYDFIILFDDEFHINYIGKYGEKQTYSISKDIKNVHITYHSSKVNNNHNMPPELHRKTNGKTMNVFNSITDINKNTEFPIPLFKITCKDCVRNKKKLQNNNKLGIIDLDNYGGNSRSHYNIATPSVNAAEVYFFAKSELDYQNHPYKWPTLDFLQLMSQIDYIVNGVDLRHDIVEEFGKGNAVLAQEVQRYNQYTLLIKKYYDTDINIDSISFYDNTNYIDMLATTPICLTTECGIQNSHYSLLYCSPFTAAYCNPFNGIFPAFCYDLDKQLENNISLEKANMWHNIFKKSLEKMQKYNIKRKGFIIPQTW